MSHNGLSFVSSLLIAAVLALLVGCSGSNNSARGRAPGVSTSAELDRGGYTARDCEELAAHPSLERLSSALRASALGDPAAADDLRRAAGELKAASTAFGPPATVAALALDHLANNPADDVAINRFAEAMDALGKEVQQRCNLPLS